MTIKNIETVSGTVESINAKQTGLKVNGEWLNISQYRPLAELPRVGQRVDVQVERSDKGAWINTLSVLDGGATTSSPNHDREIRRMAVLKAAATFCGGKALNTEVSTADVLKVAAAFERWVIEEGFTP